MSGTKIPDPIGRSSARARRLIAVVHADMVGYSHLIGLDDVGTLDRLRMLRRTLIDPTIDEHGGRIVNTGGDSLLMVFDSVDGAVRCALNVQQQIPILDGDQPPDQVIRFRFGINVGDVIPDGTDIHGDVVNVAARLQAKCPPGGICVSRAVRDHVQDRLDLSFEELGSLDLRNISRPVEAFVLGLIAPGTVPRSIERSPNPRESLPLPDRPSIAVLPFTNMSGDAEQEYFADGIVEDITTALSHVKSLFVIARNSSFTYKGRAIDVKQVSGELGVRYVLEGSVRKAGNRVRITTQLIDATTGVHVGADRFDGLLGDIFALQDEVTSTVVGTLEPSLRGAEIERAQRKHTDSLHAYDLMLRALAHFRTYNHAAMVEAIRLLRMAAAIDPNYAMSFALHAHIVHLMTSQGWLSRPNPQIDEAVRLARLAVSLGKDDAEVLSTSAISIALPGGDLLGGLALSEQALFFNPNSAHALSVNAILFAYAGDIDASIASAERATRLSPFDNVIAIKPFSRALAHFVGGDYKEVLDWTGRALRVEPMHGASLRYRAASFGLLNRLEEGQEVVRQLLSARPEFTIARARAHIELDLSSPFRKPGVAESLYEGLRRVGVPE
jgi:TolB-like protein/class 3 adenylate cyclase/tetratricopeptide (TPR) repeat protein